MTARFLTGSYQFNNPSGQELSLYRSTEVSGIKGEDFTVEQVSSNTACKEFSRRWLTAGGRFSTRPKMGPRFPCSS
jgi:hypothetical protein